MNFFNTILDSPYIIDKNEYVILKFRVEPINKQTYNFYLLRNKDNMYYLTYSIINVYYILNELRKNYTEETKNKYNQMSNKDKSLYFEKLLNETLNNKDFQSYVKNNHCYTIDILDNTKISKIIDKIKNLDFTHKKPRAQGLDGFSFDFEYNNNYIHSWCICSEIYFKPIVDLINYFLDLANVDGSYRFEIIENYFLIKE